VVIIRFFFRFNCHMNRLLCLEQVGVMLYSLIFYSAFSVPRVPLFYAFQCLILLEFTLQLVSTIHSDSALYGVYIHLMQEHWEGGFESHLMH
jgi:hypothetical protein